MVITEAVIDTEQAQQAQVTGRLKELFSQLFGIEPQEIDVHTSFLEMGADSLSLLRVSQILQEKFAVKVPFRLLLEELSTIDELATHIARENPIATHPPEEAKPSLAELPEPLAEVTLKLVPAEAMPDSPTPHATADFSTPVPRVEIVLPVPVADESQAESPTLERILSLQMRLLSDQLKHQTGIMSLQLELLQAPRASSETVSSPDQIAEPAPVPVKTVVPIEIRLPTARASSNGGASREQAETGESAKSDYFATETFVAYHPVKKEKQSGLTLQQQEHLDGLIERVTARTKESKRLTQAYRPFLADGRTSAGFRQTWKEMCYPLVIERGLGSRVFDVDHNEYVDLTMGFGALLFGHSPRFLVDALQEAVSSGVRLGGQSHIVGQVAQLICELTGVERVAFCNSGTEAVMSALRLARTVTGRTRIALFEGSYHGTFDGVMVKPGDIEADGTFNAMPLAPGVPLHMIENVLLLGYDDVASLEILRAHVHELAAVLIEPPRSRHPDVQPKAFLHELRKITEEGGAALIFDEVVTGFRFHPGGVQALFGVQADLVAYGKALGGGVPVAAVGGKARFMDATDGGMWSYGDTSYPRAETTFFAGTYFKNPLVVAAVWACLNHIKNSGPKLYEELNNRTARLATALNDYFVQEQVPMRTTHLGSLMRFLYPRAFKLMDLFFYHLLAKGIYVCETRNCFLSTAHTDEDVEKIIRAVKETIVEMRAGGIIPPRSPDSPNGDEISNYEIKDPFGGLADSFSSATSDLTVVSSGVGVDEKAREAVSLPLTEAQKQLWFLAQIDDEASVAYNMSMSLEMRGPFNLAAMRQAIQSVVNDHEALRITFSADGEYQQIAPSLALELPFVDFTHQRDREQKPELARWIDEEVRKPFDLVSGPLLRPYIIELEEDHHLLLLTIHHIITDGWSLGILLNELTAHYSAACTGARCELPRSMQFSEYVRWESDQRQGLGLERAEAYWMKQFAGAIPMSGLPSDYPRPPIQTYTGARVQLKIDGDVKGKLESFSTRQGTTLLMTLLACFNLLLHRLSGQEGVVVGIPSAGQMAAGGSLMGYCINVLPVYSRIAGDPTFTDYLSFVKKLLLDASEHQIYPLRSIINNLNLPRDPSRAPLVSVMFNVDRAAAELRLAGLETTVVQNATHSAQFDLNLNVTIDSAGLQLDCDFNTSLFSELTIHRWLGNFRSLLEAAISNPDTQVSALPLLTADEKHQLLSEWNVTDTAFASDRCLHELFEQQVERSPDSVAIIFKDEQLTYRELDRKANQLAHYLRTIGVGPDSLVGVCMERSAEMLVGLLGILKAGGAYLPLDPSYPAERLTFMIDDAQAGVLLTQEYLAGRLEGHGARLVLLDKQWEQINSQEQQKPGSSTDPQHLAYVIYTSGSTGNPKGVMVCHRNVVNFCAAMDQVIGSDGPQSWLAVTSISFDISVLELFWPLLKGGQVVIQPDEVALLPFTPAPTEVKERAMDFSLFYFASDEQKETSDKYKLLIEGAKFADRHGFAAIWTPERHFHSFGGLYPNPAVTSAAIATITERIQIRAGSVVLPLHNPIRVAEEWSVVDNLSAGRVGISIASGWHADDFVFAPENYSTARDVMFREIENVRKLWRGETVEYKGGAGNTVAVKILPRPVQAELPLWVTAAGNPDTFRMAGELGANLLTHLLGQDLAELADKISIYREALREHGHEAGVGQVTLMLHTFVGEDIEAVREKVRRPFCDYLKSSVGLLRNLARSLGQDINATDFTESDMDVLLSHAFDRYFQTGGLMGTPQSCFATIEQLKSIGVDEVACLIDFGMDFESVMTGLEYLNLVRKRSQNQSSSESADYSLTAQIQRHGVSHLQCTPSMARMFTLTPGWENALRPLRKLMLGGEALPGGLASQVKAVVAGDVLNMYGPTETTIWSATCSLDKLGSTVPIGRPIGNTQIYIVDDLLQPQPVGVPGEVYIGGTGVVRGYLNRPDLTAERFSPDPFGGHAGARLYRTGDVARYLADGEIEFLGRSDQQVKIRGFRIEVGEIEAALAAHPAIREAVVVARTEATDGTRLVAYLVPIGEAGPTVSELRLFLLDRVPDYMVPATFVMLDSLPLTPNGKVDRTALPVPDQSRPALVKGFVAARTPVEHLLARIWGEVLRLAEVGVDDNFFELGGDSILVIQAIIKSNRRGVRLTAAQFFQHQTIAGLAQVANISDFLPGEEDRQEAAKPETPLVELEQYQLDTLASRHGPIQDIYPLTPTQQGMLFQHLYAPKSKAYLQQLSCDLHGDLDAQAFRLAWQQIFARHAVLRSAFIWEALKEPLQVVSQEVNLPFREEDWRDLELGAQKAKLKLLLANEADRDFDLSQAPVSRLTLIRVADDEYKFIWSYHHLLLDGWSLTILFEEVFALYESLRNGRALELEARAPYRNYIAWLQQQDLAGAEAYWRKSLEGFTSPTSMGVDKALGEAPEVEEFGEVALRLSVSATNLLQSLTRQHKLTMNTVVQGAWGLLLAHYSGQSDVVFGTVVSGRPPELAGVETMVGLFINTLPVRVVVRPESTVVEWLGELQAQQIEARQYEYSPLVQVQGWSDVPRGVPLFESLLAFENYPLDISLEKNQLSISSDNVNARERVNYPLFVVAGPGAELTLTIYYDGRRFENATVERMLGHLGTLLEQAAANPFQQLSGMTLLTPPERQRLLVEWNDTRGDYAQNVGLHQLFEAQAARTPERLAVVSADERVTYAELDQRANQLANYLRLQGVGTELLVGICVERTVEMVVGLLAILKAGGAYVPLDPTYPKERLSFIMKDAQMRVLLTQQHLLAELPAAENAQVISLDSLRESISSQSSSRPESGVGANNLAYVIYTSGSTGTPKGVGITHRAVVNFLHSMREQPGLTDSDVLLAVTSLSFDIAGLELFLPLMVGARLELASRQEVGDGFKLMARLKESGATLMQATPTGWELLLNAGWHNDDQRLKILCGGEAFPRGLATRLLEEHGPVWNLYGPTETTIWSTMSQVVHASGSVPIGRPIANTQVYITDSHLRPTAIGIAGELYIGGDSLSRGYLGRPGLTAEKFIPDPFSGVAGGRLYRTGDVARYLPDGEIEFLGRSDQQVKIRGHRIELGEIEAALSRYQGVRQAVVIAREDAPAEKRLVAYIVWDTVDGIESTPHPASALRTHLKQSLPEYMLPALFVALEKLPLTPNGKIDRRALPAPDRTRPELDKTYVEARTAEEALLVEIWKDVLGVERVGVHDNFLELGGDSILSLQVIIRATQAGMRLTPAQLFQRQTVAELAGVVALTLPGSSFAELSDEVALTPIQHWFFEQDLPNPHHFNQAVLLEIPAHLEAALIEKAVEELFIRHDALRLRFNNVAGHWQQTVSTPAAETPFSVHDFSSLRASEQAAAIEKVANKIQRAFNLSEGPLASFALMKLDEQKSSRLLIVIHHLAVDITSWRILLEDFQAACERLNSREAVEPPARTTSFARWSQQLSRFAQSAELSVDAEYWRGAVDRKTARLSLDFEGENTEHSSDVIRSAFSREETWSLLHDTPKAFRTLPSEVLLTALAQGFAEWSNEPGLLVELEGHGRESISEELDLSRTVGWFTSLYPVLLDIADAEDSVAALKLIKEQLRDVPRGGLGFGVLKYLRPESDIGKLLWAAPRAEVSFNYTGAQQTAARDENGIRLATEKYGAVNGEQGRRPYLLMITAQITAEQLTIHWSYSKNMHRETTIRRLVESFEAALRSLINLCQTAEANTPSDFPNANLSQLDLDDFIATIGAE